MAEAKPEVLPTSDLKEFKEHLYNPNRHASKFGNAASANKIEKVKKNQVMSFSVDFSGCGHIRNIFWMTYLNSIFGKTGNLVTTMMPFFYHNHEQMMKTRTLFFPRMFNQAFLTGIKKFKEMQPRYGFKMVYDIDDYIWGKEKTNPEEMNPEYNSGSARIHIDSIKASSEIMKLMDNICVSTEFLKSYIANDLQIPNQITVLPNCIPAYFWKRPRRAPITQKITKPRVIYTGSPAHYSNEKKLYGDFDGAWAEWLIKAITDDKIQFKSMGGLPWFLEPVKNKIEIMGWVNSYVYHLGVIDFQPDIGIAPLVPNYFNYCKSDIKHVEYCATGCVTLGSVFTNGRPSPYDGCYAKIPTGFTADQIQNKVDEICEPDTFNRIIKTQYDIIDDINNDGRDARWLESSSYIKRLTDIF